MKGGNKIMTDDDKQKARKMALTILNSGAAEFLASANPAIRGAFGEEGKRVTYKLYTSGLAKDKEGQVDSIAAQMVANGEREALSRYQALGSSPDEIPISFVTLAKNAAKFRRVSYDALTVEDVAKYLGISVKEDLGKAWMVDLKSGDDDQKRLYTTLIELAEKKVGDKVPQAILAERNYERKSLESFLNPKEQSD